MRNKRQKTETKTQTKTQDTHLQVRAVFHVVPVEKFLQPVKRVAIARDAQLGAVSPDGGLGDHVEQ